MYLFTYAFDDKNANELYSGEPPVSASKPRPQLVTNMSPPSEYHLGRKAFRICKRNTRYCAWHYEMPDLFVYRQDFWKFILWSIWSFLRYEYSIAGWP